MADENNNITTGWKIFSDLVTTLALMSAACFVAIKTLDYFEARDTAVREAMIEVYNDTKKCLDEERISGHCLNTISEISRRMD